MPTVELMQRIDFKLSATCHYADHIMSGSLCFLLFFFPSDSGGA